MLCIFNGNLKQYPQIKSNQKLKPQHIIITNQKKSNQIKKLDDPACKH
jgi:hypothetical protein